MPPGPRGLKTGNPAAPSARYRQSEAKAAPGPSVSPRKSTANGAMLSGTGVKTSGIATWAQRATKALPATARAIWRQEMPRWRLFCNAGTG